MVEKKCWIDRRRTILTGNYGKQKQYGILWMDIGYADNFYTSKFFTNECTILKLKTHQDWNFNYQIANKYVENYCKTDIYTNECTILKLKKIPEFIITWKWTLLKLMSWWIWGWKDGLDMLLIRWWAIDFKAEIESCWTELRSKAALIDDING